MRRFALLCLLPLALLASPARADTETPMPAWVAPVAVPEPSPSAQGDTEFLLDDRQVQVEAGHTLMFRHLAYRVRSTAGIQESSELTVDRASDDVLRWHFVRRVRDGKVEELLPGLTVKVIQPEAKLDEGIYDGGKREVIFLRDVRVGDVIEYGYTLDEDDAVLGNRVSERLWLARPVPVRRLALHAAWPADRQVAVRAHGATLVRPSPHAFTFTRDDVPAHTSESNEPAWFESTPFVELSEFTSWADVVAWALPLYDAPVAAAVTAKAQELGANKPRAAQLERAVRFVQDEVRYLGIEEGVRALVPHPPEEVLARRFGDCKDKALLLVSLLRALGFEAQPALVNTAWRRALDGWLPSAGAFDHVIVRTVLDGRELWFDATGSYERGPIDAPHALPFERALVIAAGETGLRTLTVAAPSEPLQEVHENFALSGAGSATLHVRTTYRGARADDMRARLAHQDHESLQKSYQDFYGKRYGELTVRAPLTVEDDERTNTLVLAEHYTLAEFWQDDEQSVSAWSIADVLTLPESSRAPRPFALAYPARVRHVIELYSTGGWDAHDDRHDVESQAFRSTQRAYAKGKTEVLEYELTTTADHVATADLPRYVRDTTRANDFLHANYVTGQKHIDESSKELGIGMLVLLGVGAAVWGVVWGVRTTQRRLRQNRLQARRAFAPGQAPESAIAVSDPAKARLILRGVQCCDAPLFAGELTASEVRYGDGHLLVYRGACPQCEGVQARYFRVKPVSARPA